MIQEVNGKGSVVIWQENPKEGIGKPAILIESYRGSFGITQEGNYISLNYETIKDLIKVLKTLKEPE